MHAWEQIQQAINFIEKHLDQEISIKDLAKTASLSQFYFQRLFNKLVKKPVAEYIKLRRVAKATELLLQKDKRILDVALEVGFLSHEHFTRTFKDTFGITPEEYRKSPQTLNRMTKPELLLNYTLIDEGIPLITDGIVLEINQRQLTQPVRFVGLERKTPIQFIDGLGTESGVDPLGGFWDSFHEKKVSELKLSPNTEEIGVAYSSSEEAMFIYFAGAKTDTMFDDGEYTSWQLPQGEYVVCTFEAESFEALTTDVLYKAQHYIFEKWLPAHGLQTEPFCAERYGSDIQQTISMEIWLKVLK